MFAKDLSIKIFSPQRHQDTKFNYNKHLFFVSWCLCGNIFWFARVKYYKLIAQNECGIKKQNIYYGYRG
jgi:hypothetical protein